MTTVILRGELATFLGRAEWQFVIEKPREAIALLEANTGKFYDYLRQRHDETGGAAEYRVLVDGQEIGRPEEGALPVEFYTVGVYAKIEIVPVLRGAGGLWEAIVGVVLIVVGVVLAFVPGARAFAPYVIMAGISLTLSGVAQMLTPNPKLGGGVASRTFANADELGQAKDEPKSTPSYLFSGAVNTTQQGNPVPVFYGGPMLIGSALISLAITPGSVREELIGKQRPGIPADPFFDLPVWQRLAVHPLRANIARMAVVRAMRNALVVQTTPLFGLPDTYPPLFVHFAGRPVAVGNSTLPINTQRGWLATLCLLFSGATPNIRSVTFAEAISVARALGGLGIDNLPRSTWKTVVLAIALHYSPDP